MPDEHATTAEEVADTLAVDGAGAETFGREGARFAADTPVGRVDPTAATVGDETFDERYEIGRLLGEGGMGEVRACRDGRIGREVALKVLRDSGEASHGSGTSPRSRFEREARIQGQLEHPSVVPVYDLGVRPDGTTYFTMKRVQGLTLEEIVTGLRVGDERVQSRYGRRRLLSAFSQVCLTMAYVHSRGVVHRDLKPANIILGEFGEVYVLDWGVARAPGVTEPTPQERRSIPGVSATMLARAPIDPGDSAATEAGTVLGTPGYMAPEQIDAEPDSVDHRADIFALGAILFEILTLDPLIERGSVAGMLGTTLTGFDASPARRAPDAGVPPELDEICRKAAALDPDDRYQDARDLHDDVERFLDGERDQERRRALAARHIDAAHEALAEADLVDGKADADARTRAIGELNAALTLDPGNREAISMMVTTFVEATEHLPPEAEEALAAERWAGRRRSARIAALGFASLFLLDPLLYYMGVRDWGPFVGMVVLISVATFLAWRSSRVKVLETPHVVGSAFLACLLVATTGVLFGPVVFVPAALLALLLPMTVYLRARRSWRRIFLAFGLAVLAVPFGLQQLDLIPRSYRYEDGAFVIVPNALSFPPFFTELALLMLAIVLLFVSMKVIGRAVDALDRAERRTFAQAWSLRHLMPAEARTSADQELRKVDEDGTHECVAEKLHHHLAG